MQNAEIGHWYKISVSNDPVEVTSLDNDDQTIEFQHYDGEIEVLEYDQWAELYPIEIDSPEESSTLFEVELANSNPMDLLADYRVNS
ncbi:MAG: hypothetical protein HWE27_12710 [Gammaproteobacteria bacterium]|nr:hypothetical protein [Gammaproteobacteria bacterium]